VMVPPSDGGTTPTAGLYAGTDSDNSVMDGILPDEARRLALMPPKTRARAPDIYSGGRVMSRLSTSLWSPHLRSPTVAVLAGHLAYARSLWEHLTTNPPTAGHPAGAMLPVLTDEPASSGVRSTGANGVERPSTDLTSRTLDLPKLAASVPGSGMGHLAMYRRWVGPSPLPGDTAPGDRCLDVDPGPAGPRHRAPADGHRRTTSVT
jgi:hypothetical protein